MFRAPSFLPYSVRAFWDQRRILLALRGLDRTPPRPAAPAGAPAEVHMLFCHRDVHVGVLALKSLLRFGDGLFAVALTDDGSLTPGDRAFIDKHVPGCRWLPARSDALRDFLATHPRLASLYAGRFPLARKLLHPILLARSERVLVLDTDTAFFERPDRLLEWANGNGPPAWYLHDQRNEAKVVTPATREAFADLAEKLAPQGRTWTMAYYFFNSGLLAFPSAMCDLETAERYLDWRAAAPPRFLEGKSAIWFGEWTTEQTAYMAMFATMAPPAEPLGDRYRIDGLPGYVFNHFLRAHLVLPESLTRLAGLVKAIS